ncbi:chitin synthase-domain-containing protein [Coemansia spiralis]|nr:chitin synthase-domain-containing protein [Coemansia spiralis]
MPATGGAFDQNPSPRPATRHYRRIKGGSSSTVGTRAAALDAQADAEGKLPGANKKPGPFKNATAKVWAKITEFVMPGGYNRFGMRDERSYTESVGFLLAFVLASVAFILWGTLVPKALCTTNQTFTDGDVESRRFVSANGIVSDFMLSQTSFGHSMRGYTGYDISIVFPMLGQLSPDTRRSLDSNTAALLEMCISNDQTASNFLASWRANSTVYRGTQADFPNLCPFPQAPQSSGAQCLVTSWSQFLSSKMSQRHSSPTTAWVAIEDMVYDVSLYVTYATSPIIHNGTVDSNRSLRSDTMFLPAQLTQLFIDNAGTDITKQFNALNIDTTLYQHCMNNLFLHGTTLTTKSPFACANTNIVAWVTFGLFFLVLFSRMAVAEVYAWVRARRAGLAVARYEDKLAAATSSADDSDGDRMDDSAVDNTHGFSDQMAGEGDGQNMVPFPRSSDDGLVRQRASLPPIIHSATSERYLESGYSGLGKNSGIAKCLIVVPCFQESLETLTRTLQGIARSMHADSHKILWVINDGDAETLGNIMRILAHSGRVSDPKFYGAYGVDSGSSYGSARVYAGFYECGRHRISYIVTAKDVYQGRVDTLMMVLNFFRSVRQQQHQQRIGGDPAEEMGQQAQAGSQTIFLEEEVEACMTALGHPPTEFDYCMMIDGSVQVDPLALTQFVARMESNSRIIALSGTLYPVGHPTTLLQVLQFFEFYMCHFVSPICESLSNVTCPLNQLFTIYRVNLESGEPCLGDDDLVSAMDSLMKSSVRYRHRTWPGNDCLLVPRMARRFPHYHWAFEPNGRAEVELTAHEMVAFDPYERQWFRTRLVTLIDIRTWPVMFAHLVFPFVVPAAACMLYLEIVISLFGNNPAIVVSELTAAFVAATVLLLLASGKWQLVVAVPFYHVWIPVTSFVSMNRIWYPPEQLEAQMVAAEAQIRPPANFEAIKNSYMRRFSSAEEKQGRRKHSNSSQSSTGGGSIAYRQRPMVSHFTHGADTEEHDGSSDSEPELVDYPPDSPKRKYQTEGAENNGLGLSLISPRQAALPMQPSNLANLVVSDALLAEARVVIQKILREYPQGIEPESAEFYAVCERALKLAVAVNKAIDEALGKKVLAESASTDLLRPPPPSFGYGGQSNYGWNSGRPVSQ